MCSFTFVQKWLFKCIVQSSRNFDITAQTVGYTAVIDVHELNTIDKIQYYVCDLIAISKRKGKCIKLSSRLNNS